MKFKDIKPGDSVLVDQYITEGRYGRNVFTRATVKKVSATQFTTESGARYTRQYGSRVGEKGYAYQDGEHHWGKPVEETTAETIAEWRRRARVLSEAQALLYRADRLNLKMAGIPDATVAKIEQLLPLLKEVITDLKDRG